MSNYRFDFNQADYTLDDMHAVNARIRQALNEMQRTVEQSLAEWTGSAQTAYWDAKAQWNQAADQMSVQLENGRQALLSISDNYGTTEQRATQIWQNSLG